MHLHKVERTVSRGGNRISVGNDMEEGGYRLDLRQPYYCPLCHPLNTVLLM